MSVLRGVKTRQGVGAVLFLDVDGVLNCRATFLDRGGTYALEPTMLDRVDRIVEQTRARIVISSTWRLGRGLAGMRRVLAAGGMRRTSAIVGVTPSLEAPQTRGDEIAAWLSQANPLGPIAILDDEDGGLEAFATEPVQTTFVDGLTEVLMVRVIAQLSTPTGHTAARRPKHPTATKRCAEYLRRSGSMPAARRLAKAEGFGASASVWIGAVASILGEGGDAERRVP